MVCVCVCVGRVHVVVFGECGVGVCAFVVMRRCGTSVDNKKDDRGSSTCALPFRGVCARVGQAEVWFACMWWCLESVAWCGGAEEVWNQC